MNIQLRTARLEDIDNIVIIKRLAWPEEDCHPARVRAVLAATDHRVHVIELEGETVGFADGFLTHDAAGQARWEVDLLAVHPSHHGRGLGSRLISANTRTGIESGARLVRSLIHVKNHASESAFARSGYKPQPGEHQLMILRRDPSSGEGHTSLDEMHSWPIDSLTPPEELLLIPVNTINYRGLWQESQFTRQGFAAARRTLCTGNQDLVGAIIPAGDTAALEAAAAAGFETVGKYRWWVWFRV